MKRTIEAVIILILTSLVLTYMDLFLSKVCFLLTVGLWLVVRRMENVPLGVKIIAFFFILWGIDRFLFNALQVMNWFKGVGIDSDYELVDFFTKVLIGILFSIGLFIAGTFLLRLKNWARISVLFLAPIGLLGHMFYGIPLDPLTEALDFSPLALGQWLAVFFLIPYLAFITAIPVFVILITRFYFYLFSKRTVQSFE